MSPIHHISRWPLALLLVLACTSASWAQDSVKPDKPVSAVGAAATTEKLQTCVYPLQYRQAQQVVQVLLQLKGSSNIKLAMDEPANRIIALGSKAELDALQELIANLDTPAKEPAAMSSPMIANVPKLGCIRVVWLVDAAPSPDESSDDIIRGALGTYGYDMPGDLMQVADVVRPMGMNNLRLVGQWMARIDDEGEFNTQGSVGLNSNLEVVISGQRRQPSGLEPLRPIYDIMFEARRPIDPPGEKTEWYNVAALQTIIDAPPDHPIVMGMSTTGPVTSVFVIVRYEDEAPAAKQPAAAEKATDANAAASAEP